MNQNIYVVFVDISLQMETAVLNLFINSALFIAYMVMFTKANSVKILHMIDQK